MTRPLTPVITYTRLITHLLPFVLPLFPLTLTAFSMLSYSHSHRRSCDGFVRIWRYVAGGIASGGARAGTSENTPALDERRDLTLTLRLIVMHALALHLSQIQLCWRCDYPRA